MTISNSLAKVVVLILTCIFGNLCSAQQRDIQQLDFWNGPYTGEVVDGKAHGHGVFTSIRTGTLYVGEFVGNRRSGKGLMRWANGNTFIGIWKNDNAISGEMTFADGTRAFGVVQSDIFIPVGAPSGNKQPPTSPSAPTPNQKSVPSPKNWIVGVVYEHSNSPTNAVCGTKSVVCISPAEYRAACGLANSLTEGAISTIFSFDQAGHVLFRNGNIDEVHFTWSPNLKRNQCRVQVTVSGVYQGSSYRKTKNLGITSFVIDEQKMIGAHGIQLWDN